MEEMDWQRKRAWAEISLPNLEHNYRTLRALLEPGCRLLGVVKADAYGHGALLVGKKLEQLGCEMLAVACLDEGIALREGGIRAPVLILGETPPCFAPELERYRLIQTVGDMETALGLSAWAAEAGKRLEIQLKVDTGMTRLGFLWREERRAACAGELERVCRLPGLHVGGMFTHFAAADGDEEYTMEQFTRFLDAAGALEQKGLRPEICHCAASAAVLHYPCTHMDMVRPGILMYGHYPTPAEEGLDGPGLLPVMSLYARVCAVREVPAGTPVSYGCTHTLTRDSRLAVLSIGYGDGLPRGLSDRFWVRLRGGRAPIVGRICMDMCMADVTDLPGVEPGDAALLFGEDKPVEEAAEALGTIQYELLCAVGGRVPRVPVE